MEKRPRVNVTIEPSLKRPISASEALAALSTMPWDQVQANLPMRQQVAQYEHFVRSHPMFGRSRFAPYSQITPQQRLTDTMQAAPHSLHYDDLRKVHHNFNSNDIYQGMEFRRIDFGNLRVSGSFRTCLFEHVSFKDANLRSVDFYGSTFSCCDFRGARFGAHVTFDRSHMNNSTKFDRKAVEHMFLAPLVGSFTAFKKVHLCDPRMPDKHFPGIATLEVLDGADRVNGLNSRKCRAAAVRTVSLELYANPVKGDYWANQLNRDLKHAKIRVPKGGFVFKHACAGYDPNFKYTVGKVSKVKNFDDDPSKECTAGVHYFMTRAEAEAWPL